LRSDLVLMSDDSDNSSGPYGNRIHETSDLKILINRAKLVNERSPEHFDFDFTSLLISFLVTNNNISDWFKRYIREKRIHYLDILGHKGLDPKRLIEIQERPLEKLYSINEYTNLTRSAERIKEFALELLRITRRSESEPLDVRHIMGTYIYQPAGHREQLIDWNFNFEDWSNSFLEQISTYYPVEITNWMIIHTKLLRSIPKLGLEGIKYFENIRVLDTDKKDRILGFADLSRINYLMRESNSKKLLSSIYALVNDDLDLRKTIYGIDYLNELYRDDSLLPDSLRLIKPNSESYEEVISEKIRAIVLGEYQRLYNTTNNEFINHKISYKEYLGKIREYTKNASELWV
jgi:hypothetical protein